MMLSGDNQVTANAVARGLGIEQVRAEVTPERKAQEIETLKKNGARVAMVGDAAAKIRFDTPRTADGELVVRLDTCEGEELARLALTPALSSDAVTTLPAERMKDVTGRHDLCLRFAQHSLDRLWVIDTLQLSGASAR